MQRNNIYCSVISNLFLICYVVYLGYFLSKKEPIYFSFLFYVGFSLSLMDVCFFTILQLDIGFFINVFGFFLFLVSFGYISYDIFEKKMPNVLECLSFFFSFFLMTKSLYFQRDYTNNSEPEDIEYEDLGPV